MKTIVTKTIDGFEIVDFLSEAQIDPEATKPIANKELEKTDVYKTIEGLKGDIKNLAQAAGQAKNNARTATNMNDKKKFMEEVNARWADIKAIEEKLRPLALELVTEQRRLMIVRAKYFTPKQGEEIISDEDAAIYLTLLQEAGAESKLVTRDKKKIVNFAGLNFWKKNSGKWAKSEISKIGELPASGATLEASLTDVQRTEISAQMEIDRVMAMTGTEKLAEKDRMLAGILTRAGAMKNELEITGDKSALAKSQVWYTAEVTKVEAKYA
jgi:hypothetical protein